MIILPLSKPQADGDKWVNQLMTSRNFHDHESVLRECMAVPGFFTTSQKSHKIDIKAGRSSPIYVSTKALWERVALMASIDERLQTLNSDTRWDIVVGVPLGGIPHAVALSRLLGVPLALWRDVPKRGSHLAGKLLHGVSAALVVEDVIATGSSAAPIIALLKAVVPTVRVTAVFTYGLDRSIASKYAVDVSTLFAVDSLVDLLDGDQREQVARPYVEFKENLSVELISMPGKS